MMDSTVVKSIPGPDLLTAVRGLRQNDFLTYIGQLQSVAGYAITTHILSAAWYVLASSPEVASRLHAELEDILACLADTLHLNQ